MNSRSCRWLIVSTLLITASGVWAPRSAPPASDQTPPETFTTTQLLGAQCSFPPAFDQKSIAAFKQQAASGDAAAQCGLGLMYAQGTGVPQDYAQAALWYRKAAEQGDANAQYLLGVFYNKGWGGSVLTVRC
jgi:TPR repeat protein